MIQKAVKKDNNNYIRVGIDYFKVIEKPDRFGINRVVLKKWNRREIELDHEKGFIYKIPKFDDFIIEPNNNGITSSIGNYYNLYNKFPYKPEKGEWKWTKILLDHIFGDQYEIGLIYLQVLYLFPKQALPILTLVSKERQTGKTTFMNWLNIIFGANMIQIEPDVIGSNFNGEYSTANIIGIDETIIDKQIAIEKIKSLVTKKFLSVNMKNIQQFTLPFFGKIILCSNNEERFMKVDQEEIRFWVRKLDAPKTENHNIENDMVKEIPAFLYHLTTLPEIDFSKSRMVLTPDQIKNDQLEKVKEESKSGLYHELCELFTEYFNTHSMINNFYVIPADIKNKWFSHNNNISINYIRKTLKNEFKLNAEIYSRYIPFGEGESKPGTPFLIEREYFIKEKQLKDEELPF